MRKNQHPIGPTHDTHCPKFADDKRPCDCGADRPILCKGCGQPVCPSCGYCVFDHDAESNLKQERVRLAGCLTAATGHSQDPAKKGDYGWSPAYQAILDLWIRMEKTESDNAALKSEVEGLKAKVKELENTGTGDGGIADCGHNRYWTTHYGNCMACRASRAEARVKELESSR